MKGLVGYWFSVPVIVRCVNISTEDAF